MIKFNERYFFHCETAGEFRSVEEWSHPKRVLQSHELIVMLDGTLHICEGSSKYALTQNQMLILEPGKEHFGYETEKERLSFYWLHFRTNLDLPIKFYSGEELYEIKQYIKRLLHIANSPTYSQTAKDCQCYMIFEELIQTAKNSKLISPVLISDITEFVRLNLKNDVSVSKIAEYLNYNPDYLGKLFRKYTETGLKEYIAQQKMLKAKSLLLTTDMSIKQIAHELGYAEENLFIKFFAYHEEISPAVFRAQCYNTHINNK